MHTGLTTSSSVDELRAWAAGSLPAEAGVELLARAGVLDHAVLPGLWSADRGFDAEVLSDAVVNGELTLAQQPLTLVALSLLAGGDHAVDLSQVLSALDRDAASLVLAAVAHAAGTHTHRMIERNEYGNAIGISGRATPPLHPWP